MSRFKSFTSVICTVLILCICSCNIKSNVDESSVESNESETSSYTEYATSSYCYNEFESYFVAASDDNDYTQIYTNNGGSLSAGATYLDDNGEYKFYYTGEPIAIKFLAHSDFDTTMGFLVFINGIPQTFYTDIDPTERYLQSVGEVNNDTEKEVTLYITPHLGDVGETLNVTIAKVIGSEYRPLGAHDPMQPGFDVRRALRFELEMQVAGDTDCIYISQASMIEELEPIPYTAYELKRLVTTLSNGTVVNNLEDTNFSNALYRTVISDSKVHFFAELGGGNESCTYVISIYINGNLLKTYMVNLDDYTSRAVIDEYITITEDMYEEYSIEEFNSYAYVAVPVDLYGNMLSIDGVIVSSLDVLQQ